MSFQRACINCNRCFHLCLRESKNERGIDYSMGNIIGNDKLYSARNEALRALEEVFYRADPTISRSYQRSGQANIIPSVLAGKAMDACMKCDYSSPKIVETIKEASEK